MTDSIDIVDISEEQLYNGNDLIRIDNIGIMDNNSNSKNDPIINLDDEEINMMPNLLANIDKLVDAEVLWKPEEDEMDKYLKEKKIVFKAENMYKIFKKNKKLTKKNNSRRYSDKLVLLRKLKDLETHGIVLSQKYNINSDYSVMLYEYNEWMKYLRERTNMEKCGFSDFVKSLFCFCF